jgi:hypothetical protein
MSKNMNLNVVKSLHSSVLSQLISVKLIVLLFTINYSLLTINCFSQGISINTIGTPADNSAILDVSSSAHGLLIPRMNTAQRNQINSPATSLLIFNITTNCFEAYVNNVWYSVSCPPPCTSPSAPLAGVNTPSITQIIWNWNTVSGVTGYQWNTSGTYPGTGANILTNPSFTQTGLKCNTSFTLFVWSYNSCGNSAPAVLIQTTSACTVTAGVFITSTSSTANLGGISGANSICQSRANAASLGGIWKAWISDNTSSPSTSFTHSATPYALPNGDIVANDWAGLTSGNLLHQIDRDEFGNYLTLTEGICNAWTNTNADGTLSNTVIGGCTGSCSNWTDGSSCTAPVCPETGNNTFTNSYWTVYCGAGCSCNIYHLYCFKQ